jgi:TRAP-type C4-dicarboxylate transport system permease small subunit
MTIDPGFDKWVWLGFLGLLVVFGVRAWVVETSRGRLTRTPGRVRALTGLSVCMVAVVCGLLWVQGGKQVVSSVVNRTDPVTGLPLDRPAQPVVAPPAAPAAPADKPAAPATGAR